MNELVTSSSSDTDEERLHRPRNFRSRIEYDDPKKFYEHYRMTPRVFEELLNLVGEDFETSSYFYTALTAKDKLLITLNFLGTNDPYFCVADTRLLLIFFVFSTHILEGLLNVPFAMQFILLLKHFQASSFLTAYDGPRMKLIVVV